jgi:hypothetical protein
VHIGPEFSEVAAFVATEVPLEYPIPPGLQTERAGVLADLDDEGAQLPITLMPATVAPDPPAHG